MGKVVFLLLGIALVIPSAVLALQTLEFVRASRSTEGRVGVGGDTGKRALKKYVEFWIENKDYQPPQDPSLYAGIPTEAVRVMTNSHTLYRFVTYNAMIGMDREKVPILYDPLSLETAQTNNNLYKELGSSHAMVNTFTSLYIYSIVLFIPGALFITGSLYGLFKEKYMGLRYFREMKTGRPDTNGWLRCPGCRGRFTIKDSNRWNTERHTSCGQRIRLK